MKNRKIGFVVFFALMATMLGGSGNAWATGEVACENEVADLFPDASMADITVAPGVRMSDGTYRVDWSVHLRNETARGFCKTTGDGQEVLSLRTLHHKSYRKKSGGGKHDGFYYDEHVGKWRDEDGRICHTCTPENGFPDHHAHHQSYQRKTKLERQMEDELRNSLSRQDIESLRAWSEKNQ